MKKRPYCRSEYNRGLAQRRAYPLHTGLYKLNECDGYPRRVLRMIRDVAELQSEYEFNQYCLYQDAAEMLRMVPDCMAFELGWRFLPAVEALVGDGVPQAIVAGSLPGFEHKTLQVMDRFQQVADEYSRTSMLQELRRIRRGHVSSLVDPCLQYLDLIDRAKELTVHSGLTPPHRERPTRLCNVATSRTHAYK